MSIEDAYRSLGYTVVRRAVEDYQSALRKHCKSEIKTLEKWFLSDEFIMLCDLDGEAVIEELRKGR